MNDIKRLMPEKKKPKYLTKLEQIPQLNETEKQELQKVIRLHLRIQAA